MTDERDLVAGGLARAAQRLGFAAPAGLERLSGGASQETWAFECGARALILRRPPGGQDAAASTQGIGLATEAAVIGAARAAGAPAPEVVGVLHPDDGLGPGYIMTRLAGETLARRIQRDDVYASARISFAQDTGAALARIHATPRASLPALPCAQARDQLDLYEGALRDYGAVRPIFELGFAALRRRTPADRPPCLVHGDFRLGNLMVTPQGLSAALDWELAHLGDPAEDLGWLCTPSWRFGAIENPVGGIGQIEDLLAGYRAAGGDPAITADRVRFWAMFGALKWGVMCLSMAHMFATGVDRSIERAAIGRRASEAELDLILMLQGRL